MSASTTTQVKVLLFGAEAAAVGRPSVSVTAENGCTCSALRERLAEEIAALRPFLKTARFAINSDFAAPDRAIRDGDEVALIGLVSGG
jgi:molybdopterin converting factor small subunit